MIPRLHVFRRTPRPDLYCAVSESSPIPTFLVGQGWQYAGTLEAANQLGARERKAREAVETLGFYLFQCCPNAGGACSMRDEDALWNSAIEAAARACEATAPFRASEGRAALGLAVEEIRALSRGRARKLTVVSERVRAQPSGKRA